MCPFYRKDVVSSVTTERKKRAVRDEGEKGPTVSKKPVPVKKCKKGKWNRFGEGLKIPVPEGGGWILFGLAFARFYCCNI